MTWHIDIENIGGIRAGAAGIEPGINAIRASNWQGKSSLVNAIETAMGTATPLTEGTERGRVELTADDETIVVELTRQDGDVVRQGDTYLATERARVLADRFAFLDEDNEVRRAVRAGENLEAVLTRPLDFERIDEQIADLRGEREQVDAELERAEAAMARLPTLQERVTSLEAQLEDLRVERDELAAEAGETGTATKRDELSDARAKRDRLERQQGQLEATIANTRDRLETRREELAELEVPEPTDLEADIADAREQLAEIEQEIDLLQSLYRANKRVLDAGRLDMLTAVEHGLDDDTITCWVCGDPKDRSAVEAKLESIAEQLTDRRQAAEEYRSAVEEAETKRQRVREQRREQRDLEGEIDDLESTLADREESLESVADRLGAVVDRVEELEGDVEATDDRFTDLQSEIKFTEAELDDAREELQTVEQRAEQRDLLEAERSELTEEIEELRSRKDRIKAETRASFDDAMQALVAELGPGFEGARLTANFDLVVARDGREASLDALSEGEVELLGIVTALAGYEAFEVGDVVPVILLDSVGDLAGENLGPLVRYLADRATYLVTTAYPEQDVAEDHVIDPTEWDIVASDLKREAPS